MLPVAQYLQQPPHTFLEAIALFAYQSKASDIHIEPQQNDYRIRLRVDGVLYHIAALPAELGRKLLTYIKVLCQLNIAEKKTAPRWPYEPPSS